MEQGVVGDSGFEAFWLDSAVAYDPFEDSIVLPHVEQTSVALRAGFVLGSTHRKPIATPIAHPRMLSDSFPSLLGLPEPREPGEPGETRGTCGDTFLLQAVGQSSCDEATVGKVTVQHTQQGPGRDQRCSDIVEHKLALNRQSQKRFRERRKEREQAIEKQLAATTAELHQLQDKQQQLETRNMLLEKVSNINKQQEKTQAFDTDIRSLIDTHTMCDETSQTGLDRGVNITLPGHERHITVQEIRQFSLDMFATLWTDYIWELGLLLVYLNDDEDTEAQARMEHLTMESTKLLGCVKALNPSLYKAVCHGRLDNDQSSAAQQLDQSWFTSLPRVLSFTSAQMQDFAYLRRLYLTRRALLALERKQLMAQTLVTANSLPDPADGFESVSDLASKLCQNAQQDYEVYIKIGYAVRRGVISTKQWATMIVHAYPFFPGMEAALENIIAGKGEASMQAIAAGAMSHPMTSDWMALDDYLSNLNAAAQAHEYVPVPRAAKNQMQAQPAMPAPVMSLHDRRL